MLNFQTNSKVSIKVGEYPKDKDTYQNKNSFHIRHQFNLGKIFDNYLITHSENNPIRIYELKNSNPKLIKEFWDKKKTLYFNQYKRRTAHDNSISHFIIFNDKFYTIGFNEIGIKWKMGNLKPNQLFIYLRLLIMKIIPNFPKSFKIPNASKSYFGFNGKILAQYYENKIYLWNLESKIDIKLIKGDLTNRFLNVKKLLFYEDTLLTIHSSGIVKWSIYSGFTDIILESDFNIIDVFMEDSDLFILHNNGIKKTKIDQNQGNDIINFEICEFHTKLDYYKIMETKRSEGKLKQTQESLYSHRYSNILTLDNYLVTFYVNWYEETPVTFWDKSTGQLKLEFEIGIIIDFLGTYDTKLIFKNKNGKIVFIDFSEKTIQKHIRLYQDEISKHKVKWVREKENVDQIIKEQRKRDEKSKIAQKQMEIKRKEKEKLELQRNELKRREEISILHQKKREDLQNYIRKTHPELQIQLKTISDWISMPEIVTEQLLRELLIEEQGLGKYYAIEKVFVRGKIGERLTNENNKFHKCLKCGNTQSTRIRQCERCESNLPFCNICRQGFCEDDLLFTCITCKNQFHQIHIYAYVQSFGKCPVCQTTLTLNEIS